MIKKLILFCLTSLFINKSLGMDADPVISLTQSAQINANSMPDTNNLSRADRLTLLKQADQDLEAKISEMERLAKEKKERRKKRKKEAKLRKTIQRSLKASSSSPSSFELNNCEQISANETKQKSFWDTNIEIKPLNLILIIFVCCLAFKFFTTESLSIEELDDDSFD